MTKKNFSLNTWLGAKPQGASTDRENTPQELESFQKSYGHFLGALNKESKPEFSLADCFTPGWKADSLFSKSAKNIKALQDLLRLDAKEKLKQSSAFNHKLKVHIFREFQSSHDHGQFNEPIFNDYSYFWSHFCEPTSPHKAEIDTFIELYSFRLATSFIFKLRLLLTISLELDVYCTEHQLLNPSSFLTKFFRKGSSSEVHCNSLKSNQYSWFYPSNHLAAHVQKATTDLLSLNTSQLMRLFSFRAGKELNDSSHSHAVSHKEFGQFINHLLIFFPLWSTRSKFEYPDPRSQQKYPEVINTKFTGQKLESLVHSHWLAQEQNLDVKWSEILCADFVTDNSSHDNFIQLCQELHFITFLVHFCKKQNYAPKETIVHILRQKYSKSTLNNHNQSSLFSQQPMEASLAFDRVILNLVTTPKKNPHHYLLTQIQNHESTLTDNAWLVVLTNQKLFVPSQSSKVHTLLRKLKIEGFFNLEKLSGKGEVPNYIYVFRKRPPQFKPHSTPFGQEKTIGFEKDQCMSFHLNGKLQQFSMISLFSQELFSFFTKRSADAVTIYHKNVTDQLTLQFHQDSIVEGKLLSSLNHDQESVAHPSFFKNLTKSCSPLSTFFQLDDLAHYENKQKTTSFLGHVATKEDPYEYVLILNLKDSLSPMIEVCPWQTFPARREEYGHVYFHYFGLLAKKDNININLLREYFNASISKQIIQMCLGGLSKTKMKGKLTTLLVPNFLLGPYDIEQNEREILSFRCHTHSAQELISCHPDEFLHNYHNEKVRLQSKKENSPWFYLSTLVHLKNNLEYAQKMLDNRQSEQINFSSPLVIEKLTHIKTFPLYPNDEVYLDFHIQNKSELSRVITNTHMTTTPEGKTELSLLHEATPLVTIYSEPELLSFVHFLTKQAHNCPLDTLIQGLQVPTLQDLRHMSEQATIVEQFIQDLYDKVMKDITHNFKQFLLNRY